MQACALKTQRFFISDFGDSWEKSKKWTTFGQLLGAPNFLLNAGIISVSGVFITQIYIAVKIGLFLQFSHKSNPKSAKSWPKVTQYGFMECGSLLPL